MGAMRDCWAESFCLIGKITEQSTKLKLYVAFVIEFSYHRNSSSLSYHLNAKHPTESSPRLDGRQPTLYDFSSQITRPVNEKANHAVAVLVAGDCRPINIVEDGGLTEVIRIASGDNSYDLPSRGTIVSRIHSLADGERARTKYN